MHGTTVNPGTMRETQRNSSTQKPEPVSFPPLVDEVVVLTGPTASGKSSVAISLAKRLNAEILSLDSIAVYREMDIGTAKPTQADRQQVDHHMIDLVDPNDEFSVACYLEIAHAKVRELKARGRTAIFVGGTPMFLKAILRGFDTGPPADWEFRQAVQDDVDRYGVEALRDRLRQVDPLAAHRIGLNDTRRMIRALEVARYTGQPITHRQQQFESSRDAASCRVFALQWPRHELHERINRRVQQMFDEGLVDEIRGLISKYGKLSRTASQAVGYREVIEWIEQDGEFAQTFDGVAAHTRQLARRQETWLRSFNEIRYLDVSEPLNVDAVTNQIEKLCQ
ncbi:MAG: tRNA (adenosine(37)-N6)-dimethylallyltransferase MiaA [Rubripirellula sp.]